VRDLVAQYDAVPEGLEGDEALLAKWRDASGQPVRIEDLPIIVSKLEGEMRDLAKAMEFEKAAQVRDEIAGLRKLMGVSDGRIGVSAKRKDPRRRGRQ
jgi:excinuclease ABC subunit B